MNPGTEELLKKVGTVKNEFGADGELVKPATRYLTMQERVDREKELGEVDEFLNQPPAIMRTLNPTPDRLNNLRGRRRRLAKELTQSSPPTDLTAEEKNALYRRERILAEQIKEGMLPWEHMTRNPVGAVDQNIRWQRAKKAAILEWKNIRRALNPDSEDKDLANVEQLRPRLQVPGGPSVFVSEAEAPSKMSYSHIPDEKWEAAGLQLVTPDSPIARMEKREEEERIAALERENARLKEQLLGREEKKARIKAKRQAAMEKARAKRLANLAAQQTA